MRCQKKVKELSMVEERLFGGCSIKPITPGQRERSSGLPRIEVPAAFLVGFRRALHITHLNERNSDHHIYQRFCQSISSIIEMYLSEIRGHFQLCALKKWESLIK